MSGSMYCVSSESFRCHLEAHNPVLMDKPSHLSLQHRQTTMLCLAEKVRSVMGTMLNGKTKHYTLHVIPRLAKPLFPDDTYVCMWHGTHGCS